MAGERPLQVQDERRDEVHHQHPGVDDSRGHRRRVLQGTGGRNLRLGTAGGGHHAVGDGHPAHLHLLCQAQAEGENQRERRFHHRRGSGLRRDAGIVAIGEHHRHRPAPWKQEGEAGAVLVPHGHSAHPRRGSARRGEDDERRGCVRRNRRSAAGRGIRGRIPVGMLRMQMDDWHREKRKAGVFRHLLRRGGCHRYRIQPLYITKVIFKKHRELPNRGNIAYPQSPFVKILK